MKITIDLENLENLVQNSMLETNFSLKQRKRSV